MGAVTLGKGAKSLVTAEINEVTGGVELNGVIVTMPSTPTIGTTADLAVGTLILSPAS